MKLADLFSNYFTVRNEMIKAVENLSRQYLEWTPPNHTNSIGSLLAHIAETEYWWITIVAEQKVDLDKADFDRFSKGHSLAEILSLLDEYLVETRAYLEREDSTDWDSVFYDVKGRDERASKRWLIWHVVEHQARHRGQIFMLMRMQGLDVPDV